MKDNRIDDEELLVARSNMLQLKSQSVKTKEESCIRVNTRELNKVPSTKVSILYAKLYARLLVHATLTLAYPKDHVYHIPFVKIIESGLYFLVLFLFLFFYFLFLKQLGLGLEVIGHTVTSVTI